MLLAVRVVATGPVCMHRATLSELPACLCALPIVAVMTAVPVSALWVTWMLHRTECGGAAVDCGKSLPAGSAKNTKEPFLPALQRLQPTPAPEAVLVFGVLTVKLKDCQYQQLVVLQADKLLTGRVLPTACQVRLVP